MDQTDKERLMYCLDQEMQSARNKYPDNKDLVVALFYEVDELQEALSLHQIGRTSAEHIFTEAIQVAATALRIAMEGDSEYRYAYSYKCYRKFPARGDHQK